MAGTPSTRNIVFNDDSYWALYNKLYDNPGDMSGKRIKIQGFVYRQKNFPLETILVARNLMWCCSADMAVIGLAATGAELSALASDTWVEVSGRLGVAELDLVGERRISKVPIIHIESVRRVDRTASMTIFPY